MEKLNIAVVCYPGMGGSGILATELGMALADKGHGVHFVSSSVPFRLDEVRSNVFFHQAEANQYSVFQYPPYSLALASKIAEVVKHHKIDIIHAHYAVPHAVCAILAKQMVDSDVKVITTLHGTDISVLGNDTSLRDIIKFGIEKSDYVTSVSNGLTEQTFEMIAPKKEIKTIYNFIDSENFTRMETDLKEKLGIAPDEKVVLHVSNFRKVKRIDDVVRTFAKTAESVQAKLLFCGDGPEISDTYRLVDELGIEDKVIFLGKREGVQEIYSIADALLLLSEKESFGLVLIEAMACGVPCIGTNIGGIPEVISDGENGFIVPLADNDYASLKLTKLLTNEKMHKDFSENAVKATSERFGADVIIDEYEKMYFKLANETVKV